MKVLPFTMLVTDKKSVLSEFIELPFFYQYLHTHNQWQITYIEKGEGTLTIGNDLHAFRSGEIYVVGAKIPHLFKSDPEYFEPNSKHSITVCSVYFDPNEALESLFSLPELRKVNFFLAQNKHGFKVPSDYIQKIASEMLAVHNASGINLLFSFVKLIVALESIGDCIIPLCSDLSSLFVSESDDVRIKRSIQFIKENYSNRITLDDVANVVFMTPHSFCRHFKKHTGRTVVSFLNEIRINHACKSLISGERAICMSAIASNSGFNTMTNFNRVFKRIIGQSPTDYIDNYSKTNKKAYSV
ncbi:AraC family transcriptional regulator [Pedobacter sp. KBW01]|uniref:helix-turn-helix domain-containing protein n=1 Tax=Pedobacter sp. KBW01 TaxID=2153364 RepID=UPI000F5A151B|nr:helix-turn-helix domain-containing protein [Pedobacter sp. KBW01]RQO64413.1 AraC family transcriptional regulator [Pedobacter sp. KBW01]